MGHFRGVVKRGSYMDSIEGSVTGIHEEDNEEEFYDSDDFSNDSDKNPDIKNQVLKANKKPLRTANSMD